MNRFQSYQFTVSTSFSFETKWIESKEIESEWQQPKIERMKKQKKNKNNQRKTRCVCVCVSRRRQPLQEMHVTYATLQRTNEKIVFIIKNHRIGIRCVLYDRRDVEICFCFIFQLLPSFLEFLSFHSESTDKDVNFVCVCARAHIWAWFHLFFLPVIRYFYFSNGIKWDWRMLTFSRLYQVYFQPSTCPFHSDEFKNEIDVLTHQCMSTREHRHFEVHCFKSLMQTPNTF